MPSYRYSDKLGRTDNVIVIEDARMVVADDERNRRAGHQFINRHTIRAHPVVIDVLLQRGEAE